LFLQPNAAFIFNGKKSKGSVRKGDMQFGVLNLEMISHQQVYEAVILALFTPFILLMISLVSML